MRDMRCSACQRESPPDASFCSQCGASLRAACPDCGRPAAPDAAFCGGCGRKLAAATASEPSHRHDAQAVTPPHLAAKILRDRAVLEGERRTVTVLFIDAVGSVATGGRIDQEELHRITHQATERMVAAVHHFEGTVTQFRGDGIMALFGAPIAHEDTARRGMAAAIAMRDSLAAYDRELRTGGSSGFTYRIGLHTGPVIVGRIGDDLSMDYTAVGDTVNLAARMEQWAAPGKIYVTDQTRRLAAGYFEFGDLGALEVKGKSEAVRAFEVERELASRTRLDVAAEAGLSPYVGRAHELSVLRSHFDQAKEGHGQVVFISGEAGMGKSRLMLEFRRALEGEDFTWLTGQCISYGSNIPYLPIADLLKRNFGVEETDDEAAIIGRVEERAANWNEATQRAAPYVKFLLNVDPGDARVATMDPVERRAGIFDALRALLIRGSSQRPVVMLIEDLHWIDEKSEEAIAALVEITAAARVLMILTYRPGYASSLGERNYYNRLSLRHLPDDESDAMLGSMLAGGTCPEEIRRLITSKAEGNPFYLEEVTKSLVESGMVRVSGGAYALTRPIDQVRIPETIQEVILTRIDRLDRDAKDAIQLASVIGREFTVRLLERMSETKSHMDVLLGELKTLELIYEKAYFPELSYMFKHALTHDVAYSTLLNERRKALHRIVGVAIEELYADRLAEQYETLAYHYERGEDWPKALEFLTKAAEKAEGAYANADAISFYDRAVKVYDRLPPESERGRGEVLRSQGKIHLTTGNLDGSESAFRAAALASARAGDDDGEALSLAMLGMAQLWAHEFEQAQDTARDVLARDIPESVRAAAELLMAGSYVLLGELDEQEAILSRRPRISEACDPYFRGFGEGLKAGLSNWRAQFADAERLVTLADQAVTEAVARCEFLWLLGVTHCGAGNYDRALECLQQEIELSERVGDGLILARTLNSVSWIYSELQDFERAIDWNERSVKAALEMGLPDQEISSNARLNLADCYIALGRFDEAEELIALVEGVVRNPRPHDRWMLWSYAQHMCATAADLWLARGDAGRALGYADECIERAAATGRRKNEVKGRRARAQALIVQRRLDEAERELVLALEMALEVGNPPQIWKTHEAFGDLRRAQGRPEDARAAYVEAQAVVDGVAASLTDPELRATLIASPAMQRLRELAPG